MKKIVLFLAATSFIGSAQSLKKEFTSKVYINNNNDIELYESESKNPKSSIINKDNFNIQFTLESNLGDFFNEDYSFVMNKSNAFKENTAFSKKSRSHTFTNIKTKESFTKKLKNLSKISYSVDHRILTSKYFIRFNDIKINSRSYKTNPFISFNNFNFITKESSDHSVSIPSEYSSIKNISFDLISMKENFFEVESIYYKNFLKKDSKPSIQVVIVFKYNYLGELLSTNVQENEINNNEDKFLGLSYNSYFSGTYRKNTSKQNTPLSFHDFAFCHITSTSNNKFTHSLIKNIKGYYILLNCYDLKNSKLWTKKIQMNSKFKNKRKYSRSNFFEYDNKLVVSIYNPQDNYFELFTIDLTTGEVLDKIQDKVEFKIAIGSGVYDTFTSIDEVGSKVKLNIDTYIAYHLNSNFKDYLLSKKDDKSKLRLDAQILNNSINIIENDHKNDKYKLLKFEL